MQNPQCLLCLVGLIIQSEMYVKLVSDTKFSFYIETNLQISRFRRCTLRGAELQGLSERVAKVKHFLRALNFEKSLFSQLSFVDN